MSTFTTFIQHIIESPNHSNQIWKRNKRNPIEKLDVKLSLFVNNMTLYIENPKDATDKLLEVISEFSKFSGYKINIYKSVEFLYTSSKLS